ncbi:MBL fold metallo-hydrolase, partial [Burkholderia pseudomallei]
VLLDLPLADPLGVALTASRRNGLRPAQFEALLDRRSKGTRAVAVAALFSDTAPPRGAAVALEPRVRYFGDGCVLVVT